MIDDAIDEGNDIAEDDKLAITDDGKTRDVLLDA